MERDVMNSVPPIVGRYPTIRWRLAARAAALAMLTLLALGPAALHNIRESSMDSHLSPQHHAGMHEAASSVLSVRSSLAAGVVTVTGIAANHSSAVIYYNPVAGAMDYRAYDVSNPGNVKYAGLVSGPNNTSTPATQI